MAIKAGRISIHDANDLDESSCCASEGPSRLPHVGCGLINESQTLRLARLFVETTRRVICITTLNVRRDSISTLVNTS